MAFKLHIGFVGECLFVPGQATPTTPATMHVLLPVVAATDTTEAFVGTVCFDPAYQQAGSPSLTGGVAMLPLQRVSVALGRRGDPVDLSIPPRLAPIGTVTGRSIIPALLGNNPPASLTARVDLLSGGISVVSDGADWAYPDCGPLTNSLLWSMDRDGDRLDLNFSAFPGPGGFQYSLHPVDGVIRLDVYSTPVSDLPPSMPAGAPPPFGTALRTFGAYYQMFEPSLTQPSDPLPTYCGMAQAAGPYTCMVAQSG